jgi:hypothetical protein
MDIIIFDLDGTLALNAQREHLIKSEGWDAYFLACDGDTPNYAVIDVLQQMVQNDQLDRNIEIWSGRGAISKIKTLEWLRDENINYDRLRMRAEGDHTPDDELKESWLNEEIAAGNRVLMVFDDRDKVVAMWRRNGITCLQVAPGDF